jgi:Ca-activated chloride channel family protein
MKFYQAFFLYFIPLIILLFWLAKVELKKLLIRKESFISEIVLNKIIHKNLNQTTLKNNFSIILLLLVITSILIALARPLGKEISTEIEEKGRDIVIALDISDSMLAKDVTLSGSYSQDFSKADLVNISRFEAGKKIIKGLLKELETDRVSLVVFSDGAFTLLPLSNDYDLFNSILDNIDFNYTSGGGTDLGEAIKISMKRFSKMEKEDSKTILLLSDGEEQNQNSIKEAETAKKAGAKIITIGLGTTEGSKIPLGKDFYGKESYKTYMGEEVISKLNDKNLKEIAKKTGSYYFEVNNDNISEKLHNLIQEAKEKSYKTTKNTQYQEFFQIFILIALLLFFIEKLVVLYL